MAHLLGRKNKATASGGGILLPMQSQSRAKNTSPSRLRLTLWQTGEALVFFFAAKSENKKCTVFFHTPIRNLSFHSVIRMKARFNHTVGRVWLREVDPKSLPTFIASCPRLLLT
jgi:hypothetical protein